MDFNLYMPVRIISGINCVVENFNYFSSKGKRCLVVTGKNSAKESGALDDAVNAFKKCGIEYRIFDKISQNPLTDVCREAGNEAIALNADFILGIGGGSVLDAAKAIAIFACYPEMKHNEIYLRKTPSSHLPVILIGTTSGTGSEVTGVSVLTNSDTGIKKSISGPDCYADIAFCDYRYTKSVNTDVRISTALDAFSHAAEAYLSANNNEAVDAFALKSISLSASYLLDMKFDSLSDEDFEKLYLSSVFAGLAINTAGTCFPHTVGYYFTETFNVPHGKACALLLPEFFDRAKKNCPERLSAILSVLGCDYEKLIGCIKSLSAVKLDYSEADAEKVSLRWKDGVKNFDRTPGGFTYIDAQNALKALIS